MDDAPRDDVEPPSDGFESDLDADFELALHTSERDAFTGFSNLGPMRVPAVRDLRTPWREC